MALIKFSAEEVGSNESFELVPNGKYQAQISNHEWKETKSGGHMLVLTLEITGPSHEGRKLWDNLNIDCSNETAAKIAIRSYKAICTSCGAMDFYEGIFAVEADTVDEYLAELPNHLYGHTLTIDVVVELGKGVYSDKNKIKGYLESAPVASPPAAKKPSWKK